MDKDNNASTDKPWKRPGQSSQNPDERPTSPNVVEEEKGKKDALWDKAK